MMSAVRSFPTALAIALLGIPAPRCLDAQSWSTIHSSRQVSGETGVEVEVRYSAGSFTAGAADPGVLYRMRLEYDEETFRPLSEYRDGRLVVGVEGTGARSRLARRDPRGELDLRIGPDVPVDLRLDFGAVRADIDLGGMRLSNLDLSTGASEAQLRVSQPNPTPLGAARIRVGAASFHARELGNLNADRFEIEAGVGDVQLDFSGSWERDARAEVKMGIGSLEVRVPRELGVRLSRNTFLTSVETEGFERRGNDLFSSNWESAEVRLELEVSATLGSVRVVRVR